MITITKNKWPWPRRLLYAGTIFATVVLLSFASFSYWDWFSATQQYHAATKEVVTVSTNRPDEKKPDKQCAEYSIGNQQAVEISLPSINITGCVQTVGVDQNNSIAVPTNIHLAGWYNGSPQPGERGVSLIDGHVLGRYNDAIFKDLNKLKVNDQIIITNKDKTTVKFAVVDSNSYKTEDTMKHLLKPLDGVDYQLTLVTCIGTYNSKANTYDKRLVVRAKMVDSTD